MTRFTLDTKKSHSPLASNQLSQYINNLWERDFNIFDQLFNESYSSRTTSLPYNTIILDDTSYRIEIALAGYKQEDIDVYQEDQYIHVIVDPDKDNDVAASDTVTASNDVLNITKYPHYIHKGISSKYAKFKFGMPTNSSTVEANYLNGILSIDIKVIEDKPKRSTIKIKYE